MKTMLVKFLVAVALCSGIASTASAAPMTQSLPGTVNILGTDYSVWLLFDSAGDYDAQTFNLLSPTITFTNLADATAAAQAILTTYGASYPYSPLSGYNGVRVIYENLGSSNNYLTVCCSYVTVNGPFNNDNNSGNYFSIAQFSATDAPEPETFALMALGLAGLRVASRRRHA